MPEAESGPALPLEGVVVVDLSRLVSGNMLTHVLADLGATVIKVEAPRKGDELRAWQRQGVSTYWLAYSRNKDSVELDMRSPEGRQALHGGSDGVIRPKPRSGILGDADEQHFVRAFGRGHAAEHRSRADSRMPPSGRRSGRTSGR